MKPQIQSRGYAVVQRIGGRHNQPIRLHGLINAADIAANHQTCASRPFGCAVQQLLRSRQTFQQQRIGPVKFLLVKKFVVIQSTPDGSFKNHHVGQQRLIDGRSFAKLFQFLLQQLQLSRHCGATIVGNGDSRCRNPPHIVRQVVLQTVAGLDGGERKQADQQQGQALAVHVLW